MLDAWPGGKITLLKRNGIANVQSALNYFKVEFDECCRNWTRCYEAWDRIRPMLGPEVILEIEHEILLDTPVEVSARLARHLSLESETAEALMRYIVHEVSAWRSTRNGCISIDDVDWSVEHKRMFFGICIEQMVSQGYLTAAELRSYINNYNDNSSIQISPQSASVLRVDDPIYFKVDGDSLYIVPGRQDAALVIHDRVVSTGMRRLKVALEVVHPIRKACDSNSLVLVDVPGH